MNRYTRADGPDIQLKVGEQCGDTTKATLLPARLKMSRIAMAGSKVRKCPEFLNQTIYLDITRFMSFVRHCVECPKCLTRYLAAFSPYRNGSFLIPTVAGSSEEYLLYCSCGQPPAFSRWSWNEVKTYAVSKPAHHRGYGTAAEIVPLMVGRCMRGGLEMTGSLNLNRMRQKEKFE